MYISLSLYLSLSLYIYMYIYIYIYTYRDIDGLAKKLRPRRGVTPRRTADPRRESKQQEAIQTYTWLISKWGHLKLGSIIIAFLPHGLPK